MKTITKIILCIGLLFLLIGTVSALKETSDVKVKDNTLEIDGKQIAEVKQYNDSSCIDTEILSRDSEAIIKAVDSNGATEVTSIDNPRNVYEIITNTGMYYTFGDGEHTYIVVINEDNWNGNMLSEMDKWCIENSK